MALIPTDRITTWTPGTTVGVVGGIPDNRLVYDDNGSGLTAALLGIDNTGTTDVWEDIYNVSLLATNTDKKVVLRSGIFKVLGTAALSRMTLAGQGIDETVLRVVGTLGFGYLGDPSWTNSFNSISDIASGLTAGSTTIVVTDAGGGLTPFSAGRMAQIQWENDLTLPVVSTTGLPKVRRFNCMVTAVSGTSLTITPPIPAVFPTVSTVRIIQTQLGPVYNCGVEDLTIDGTIAATMTSGVTMGMTYNCWVKNVKVLGTVNYGIQFYDSVHGEVTHSWVGPTNDPLASNHAGFLCNTCSGMYEYDNVIEDNFPGIEINQSVTASVFAYNLVLGANFGINTNHGPHNSFNLYEGNVVSDFISDGYFGSESEVTIYRNWVLAVDPQTDDVRWTVACGRMCRKPSIFCNIMGTPGITYTQDGVVLGNPNLGNSNSTGSCSPPTTQWRDRNADGTSPYFGEVTARSDANHGEFTLSSGTVGNLFGANRNDNIILLTAVGDLTGSRTFEMSHVGDVITLDSTNGGTGELDPIPALNTEATLWAGPGGFQEHDDGVEATLERKGNYYVFTGDIPAGESTGAEPIPDSYVLPGKPDWFFGLNYPPFDAENVGSPNYSQIPAGYRYEHGGADPPSSGDVSFSGPGSTTFGGSGTVTFA